MFACLKHCKGSSLIEYAFVVSFSLLALVPATWGAVSEYSRYFRLATEQVQLRVLPAARFANEGELASVAAETSSLPQLVEEGSWILPLDFPVASKNEPEEDPPIRGVVFTDENGNDLTGEVVIPTDENAVCVDGRSNPGNDKCVGRAGEAPNGYDDDWGSGSRGMSDGDKNGRKDGDGKK